MERWLDLQSTWKKCVIYRRSFLTKSTIACALEQHLLHLGKFAYRLDGDNIRFGLNKDLGFDEKSRNENIRRIGEVSAISPCFKSAWNWAPFEILFKVAKLFADAACVCITAFISPYRVDRDTARALHAQSAIDFIEVFVDAPLSVVEARDPKGLYKKARAGEIKGLLSIYLCLEDALIQIITLSRLHGNFCSLWRTYNTWDPYQDRRSQSRWECPHHRWIPVFKRLHIKVTTPNW